MDDDMDILAALIDEDLNELERDIETDQNNGTTGSSSKLQTSVPETVKPEESLGPEYNGERSFEAAEKLSRDPLQTESPSSRKLASSSKSEEKQSELSSVNITKSPTSQQSTITPSSKKLILEASTSTKKSAPLLQDVNIFKETRNGVAKPSEVHTGLTDYESSDDESLTSSGKEVNSILKKRETDRRKKENPFKPHMSSNEQDGWSKAKLAEATAKAVHIQIDPFSGIRIRNPVVSSDSLRSKMIGRKMVKISTVGSYLHKMKDREEDWVTIAVVVHKSDPKSSNKSGKLFSVVKLGDLQNLEISVQLFLFNNVHTELWQRLQEGRVVGLLNARMLPNREGSQDTSLSIDHAGKLLELGDAQDYGTCQGRTRAGQKCSNVVNKSQCAYCVFHVKAEFQKMSSKRPECQSSYSGADPGRLRKAVFEATGGVYGVPKGMAASMTRAELRASLRPIGSTNAERKQRERLILSNLELKRKADTHLESMAKKKPSLGPTSSSASSSQNSRSSVADEFIEAQLKTHGPGARLMRIALGKEEPPSSVQKLSNGIIISEPMSPGELLRQHAFRKQVVSMTPKLSGSPGGMVSLGPNNLKGDSKLRAARILKGAAIAAVDPNAVKRSVDKNRVLQKVEDANKNGTDEADKEKFKNVKNNLNGANVPKGKKIVLGREVDEDDVKKMLARKSTHQHEVDEVEEAAKEAYFAKLERKEALEQKMLSTMSVKVKVVSCATCRYTAVAASDYCQKQGHAIKTHEATKRFFRCLLCKNRTISFCKLPSKPCRRCESSEWERVAMWSEREGPRMDYEILQLRGQEKKFIDSI
ncbi:protein MCM10 homolog [Varroa destructor]|uniref:Protein MCM10 homolog n=1 Tax=Varroa destructor TaxID=109461 RepID=A0A7M7J0V8_VARDE|nr:protein MCM10 homolog [Varroa destructor]